MIMMMMMNMVQMGGSADHDLLRRYNEYRRLARVSVVMATVAAVVVSSEVPDKKAVTVPKEGSIR